MLKKALVLAAGLGTRLRPITETLPKAMAPIAGHPILEYTLDLCSRYGLAETAVNTHYFPETITSYFGDQYKDIRITYSHEEDLLENAGALKKLEHFFSGEEAFLVIASDNLVDVDLERMFRFHSDKKSLATIATVTREDASLYGIAQCNDDDRILTFQEKPKPHEALGDQVATCIYLFSPRIFDFIPSQVPSHFGKSIFPRILEAGEPIYAFRHAGYWNDVGNAHTFLQANLDVLDRCIEYPFGEVGTKNHSYIHPSVRIEGNCQIKDSVLFPGVVINDCNLERCIIVDDAVVEKSSLRDTIIGAKSRIMNATLSEVAVWPDATIKGV